MIAFAHWHFSEMQPPRPPRGVPASDGGEFNHPDRLAAAPPTQFLRWAMSGVQTVMAGAQAIVGDVQLVTLRVSRTSLPYKTTLHPKKRSFSRDREIIRAPKPTFQIEHALCWISGK